MIENDWEWEESKWEWLMYQYDWRWLKKSDDKWRMSGIWIWMVRIWSIYGWMDVCMTENWRMTGKLERIWGLKNERWVTGKLERIWGLKNDWGSLMSLAIHVSSWSRTDKQVMRIWEWLGMIDEWLRNDWGSLSMYTYIWEWLRNDWGRKCLENLGIFDPSTSMVEK